MKFCTSPPVMSLVQKVLPREGGAVSQTHYVTNGQRHWESVGTQIQRTTYHYFYHIGESQAIRQLMGHQNVGDFVGHIGSEAPYIPETI